MIQPNGVFDGYSFTGHFFRVRDEASKADLGLIVVEPAVAKLNIWK
ncbi:MAG: hypothetical protein ACR2MG_05870 [Pyrinomonadaceae bacterium]